MVDKRQIYRIELPPDDFTGEAGWVEVARLSASDFQIVDRQCQRLGIQLQTVSGMIMLASRGIRGWSLPLPVDPSNIAKSLGSLTIELITYIGQRLMEEDGPLSAEAASDFTGGLSVPPLEESPSLTM